MKSKCRRSAFSIFLISFSISFNVFAKNSDYFHHKEFRSMPLENIIIYPKINPLDRHSYLKGINAKNLKDHKLIIRNLKWIDPKKLADIESNGKLTAEIIKRSLPSMLKYIEDKNLILNPDKVNDLSCYNVFESKKNLGVNTGQLFFIKVCQDCLKEISHSSHNCEPSNENLFRLGFIFKGVKTGLKEIKRLHRISLNEISEYSEKGPTLRSEKRNERIILTMDLGDYYYLKDPKVKSSEVYFSLLEAAHGKSFYKWIDLYATAKKENDIESLIKLKPIIESMFKRLGSSLSKIHQDFKKPSYHYPILGKTYIHGDLHAENCFYDPTEDQIYFIDNETLAMSFGEKKFKVGIKDISDLYSLHSIKTLASLWSKQLTLNIDERWMISDYEWHTFWTFLLDAYISSFPPSLRNKQLVEEIKRAFLHKMNPPVMSTILREDQRELKLLILQKIMWLWLPPMIAEERKAHLQKNYLDPLFEDLKKKYDTH